MERTGASKSFAIPAALKVAWADVLIMALAILLVSTLSQLFAGPASQRVVTYAAIMLTAVVGLQIFSGNTSIVSFGHSGFLGLGAYMTGILTMPEALQRTALKELPSILAGYHLPFFTALAIVLLVAIIVGLITGMPLLRLSGSSASIATLALLIIIYTLLVGGREITRGSQPFYGVPRDVGLWTATLLAVIALGVARIFRELPLGLAARAAANDERGAAAVGVNHRIAYLCAWVTSVVISMAAGAALAQFLGAFSPKDFYFELSFTLLAMLIVGGMNSSLGAFAGVVVTTIIIEVIRRFEGGGTLFGFDLPALFGLTQGALAVIIILIIWKRPEGLLGKGELNILKRFPKFVQVTPNPTPAEPTGVTAIGSSNLTRRYAGVVAVEDITLEFRPDMITGIIGPNGAGKTTFINMMAGDVVPSSGSVHIGLQQTPPETFGFARAGIARTFQNIRIFPNMTVMENVVVAARQVEPSLMAAEAAAMAELTRMGLQDHAQRHAAGLAYGLRRRLEVARALALKPRYLLLDEPAAGMNAVETAELIAILAAVRSERKLGIILIEHDMRLVMNLCERIVVIDHGRVIADGSPVEVQNNPAVIAAYLGSRSIRNQSQNIAETKKNKGIYHNV
ncbi:branched-chain amino acid ABC transporter ATP-binding protein/permease [Phyllobacterium sp. SB3]|uniref:branched-chain amino acid ABC transporter ATP-binding protein/permease n=1 Tax=Phyllobacterium sp. SB3 TaxID=3156073 RepID=UPI0032AEE37F